MRPFMHLPSPKSCWSSASPEQPTRKRRRAGQSQPVCAGWCAVSAPGADSFALVRDGLRAGTVALNGPARSDPRLPFGVPGDSGHGVELGEEGLLVHAGRVVRTPRTARAPLRLDRTDHHFELPAPVVDALRRGSVSTSLTREGPRAVRCGMPLGLRRDLVGGISPTARKMRSSSDSGPGRRPTGCSPA